MKEVEKAKETVQDGGVIVYPTETAYAIGGNALNEEIVDRVYDAKQRPRSKGLTVIVSSLEMAENHAELSDKERILVNKFMPGPLTLVVEKKNQVPDNLNDKFVFRISSSPISREIASEGPVIATSANISGSSTSYSVGNISDELLDKVDFVLDKGRLPKGPTSTIAEVKKDQVFIHREGPIKLEELEAALDDIDIHN